MPRRKAAEVELLPPEDDQQPRGRKKLVEAEHTIKYSAPVPVTVEADPEEDSQEEDFDFVEKEKSKRRKKTAKEERDELRREMDKLGVAGVSRLKLSIDKYRHSDSDDSGTLAEKDYCTKYPVTKDHILNDEYMDVARRYGPGRYWFTLRMDNVIARQWERQVNAVVTPSGPVIQNVNPADPTSPQVIYQSTNGDGQAQQIPMSIKDIMKTQREALKEQLEMAKLMREAYGFAPEAPQQQQQTTDPELAALHLIAKNPDVMEKLATGMAKTIFGSKGGGDDTPWWADIIKDSVTTGQLAPTVQAIVKGLFPNGLFGGFANLFTGGQQNGQAPIHQTPVQNQAGSSVDEVSSPQGFQQSQASLPQGDVARLPDANMGSAQEHQDSPPQQATITPEQHALSRLIQNCQRNVPVQVAYQQLVSYADRVEDEAPDYSIYGYIDLLGQMTTDQVLEFVKALPGGEQVVALPHCREWCEGLQKLIQESQEGGEE